MIEISNERCRAAIEETGAELRSFQVDGDEVIWQSRPEVWTGSAPILFPIVGRLKAGAFTHRGQRYDLAKHGLVRKRGLDVEQRQQDRVTFRFVADDETRAVYPFEFVFRVTFSFEGRVLRIDYEVANDGDDELLFSLGSHPAIRLPLEAAPLQDYFIELDRAETLGRYRIADDLLDPTPAPFLDNAREIPLTAHLFDDDALIFRGVTSRAVSVCCRSQPRVVTVDTGGAPDLGLWAKPGADYVCVEPWWGHDDPADVTGELSDKPGILRLASGARFETGIRISLTGGGLRRARR